jgi:hypothetical protein
MAPHPLRDIKSRQSRLCGSVCGSGSALRLGYFGPQGITGTVEMLLAGEPSMILRLMAR